MFLYLRNNLSIIFFFLFLLNFISCSDDWLPYNPDTTIKFDYQTIDIDTITELNLLRDEVVTDSIVFPMRMSICGKYLFVSDMKSSYLIHVFDINENRYLSSIIKKGKGEGEHLYVWELDCDEKDNILFFNDPIKNDFVVYEIEEITSTIDSNPSELIVNDLNFEVNASSSIYKNHKYYFTETEIGDWRFATTNSRFNNISFKGILPQTMFKKSFAARLFDAKIDLLNENIIISHRYLPLISIFNKHGELIKSYFGPEHYKPTLKRSQYGSDIFKPSKKTKYAYFDLYTTEEKAYFLYDGKVADRYDDKGNVDLIIMDDSLELIKLIKLPVGIFGFCIYNDRKVFGITYLNGVKEIVYFDIP